MAGVHNHAEEQNVEIVAVCDVWGCPLSRVIDSYEMFSEFLEGNIGGGERPEEQG